jgi:hypothetical protein
MAAVETNRIGLIVYDAPDGTSCVASGLLVSEDIVLTADHVAEGTAHRVQIRGRSYDVVHVLRSGSSEVDLAILLARVDRDRVGKIHDCAAVGFPRWKRDGNTRRSAQVDGAIPTGEGLEAVAGEGLKAGLLTLVGNRKPATEINRGAVTEAGTSTPWGCMSGAVVVAAGRVIGVVRSVNLAADGQSLTITPVTAIDDLTDDTRKKEFWDALRVTNSAKLPLLPELWETSSAVCQDYEYDIYVSYWSESCIDPWVRKRFLNPFRDVLVEELGRRPTIVLQQESLGDVTAIRNSRVLLAILSKQYFYRDSCRTAFDSMFQRELDEGFRTTENPMRLVHAIIAHDCGSDESVPSAYRGSLQPVDFKKWAYDFEIQDWTIHTSYADAVRDLASQVADAVQRAPAWRDGFPLQTPASVPGLVARKPTF